MQVTFNRVDEVINGGADSKRGQLLSWLGNTGFNIKITAAGKSFFVTRVGGATPKYVFQISGGIYETMTGLDSRIASMVSTYGTVTVEATPASGGAYKFPSNVPGMSGALDGSSYDGHAALGLGGVVAIAGLGYLAYKMLKKR